MFYSVVAIGTSQLDPQWVTDFMGLVKEGIALCSEFPLNLLLTACLVAAGIGIFARAKRALVH